jgi:hypothetical protein
MATKDMGGMRGAGANARGLGQYGRGGAKPSMRVPAKPKAKPKGQTLYHGSAHPFKSGEVVKPFRTKNGGASATSSYKFAKSYATGRGGLIPKGLQGLGKSPRVFEVKPVSKSVQSKKFGGREYNDAKGYRIVKEAKPPAKPAMKTSPKKRK